VSEFRTRFGIVDCVLFCVIASPVRLNARHLVALPATFKRSDFDDGTLCCAGLADSGIMPPVKYWEIVADKLSAAGWSWGCV